MNYLYTRDSKNWWLPHCIILWASFRQICIYEREKGAILCYYIFFPNCKVNKLQSHRPYYFLLTSEVPLFDISGSVMIKSKLHLYKFARISAQLKIVLLFLFGFVCLQSILTNLNVWFKVPVRFLHEGQFQFHFKLIHGKQDKSELKKFH